MRWKCVCHAGRRLRRNGCVIGRCGRRPCGLITATQYECYCIAIIAARRIFTIHSSVIIVIAWTNNKKKQKHVPWLCGCSMYKWALYMSRQRAFLFERAFDFYGPIFDSFQLHLSKYIFNRRIFFRNICCVCAWFIFRRYSSMDCNYYKYTIKVKLKKNDKHVRQCILHMYLLYYVFLHYDSFFF